jgi:hypothetical protein
MIKMLKDSLEKFWNKEVEEDVGSIVVAGMLYLKLY